ncbi:MAG: CRISPR-associated endonuclease Cas1 [Thermoguttaceae bacterium]
MDESLWPARNIAEYAYCPRLFYYMEVEGIHVPSEDTEEGNRVHRRVDAPSAECAPDGSEDPVRDRTVRSMTLASPALQLTATLDLVELSGSKAVPVEYRKGRPRRIPADGDIDRVEPWPTDRVQVGLQALLLVEAGYEVPEVAIYYAAEKRRIVLPCDEALLCESRATLEAAKQCAEGPRPLPLLNDPRCPRCSLQSACLPDEVNQQRAMGEVADAPRRLWPPRDEGIHLVAQRQATRIGVRGAAMTISDDKGAKLKDIPLANLESLSLLGSVQISTQAIALLAGRGIPIAFLTAAGRLAAIVDPLDSVSADTRRAQVRKFDQPGPCLELARAVVSAKIANQRTLLMRNHAALPAGVADAMAQEARRAIKAESLDSLRGHEGQAAAIYFAHFAGMIKSDLAAEFDANGRQRRPPPDPVNACLSFAYSMLTHECVAAARTARLEPSIGAFHVSRPGRPALALDLMEPFRPLVADSVAIAAFNRGELQAGHFLRTAAGAAFTDAGRKAFFGVYGRRMDEEVTHPVFGYRMSYRRMLVLHARMVAAWLNDEIPSLAFLTTR